MARSLKDLLMIHELIFVLLVALAGGAGGYGIHLWRDASSESVRIGQLMEETQQTRGDMYRQMKELFDAQFLADSQAPIEYEGYTQRIETHFHRLQEMSKGEDEMAAIDNMRDAYHQFLIETRGIFKLGVATDSASLKNTFNTNLELKLFSRYESMTSDAEKLFAQEQQTVRSRLRQANRIASILLTIPVLLALALLIFSRIFLQRSIAQPLDEVLHASQQISAGKLQHRVPETGAAELTTLARAINHMANSLKLSQEALLRSEKQVAQGALVPVLAHNIRNPLASIRATAQVIDAPDLESDISDGLKGIISTVDRLENWTGALLAYLHPLKPQYAAANLRQLVDGALALLQIKLKEKAILVNIAGCDDIVFNADIHLMEQAIYNLLLNAIDASPVKGSIDIIGMRQDDRITLQIVDVGVGMPFIPEFNSLSPGPSTKRFGTGLGIPFAFKVCEAHGGGLDFTSGGVSGTIVTMHFNA